MIEIKRDQSDSGCARTRAATVTGKMTRETRPNTNPAVAFTSFRPTPSRMDDVFSRTRKTDAATNSSPV